MRVRVESADKACTEVENAKIFWSQFLQGSASAISTPLAIKRSLSWQSTATASWEIYSTKLPASLNSQLLQFSQTSQVKISVLLSAVWSLLLCRYSGETTIQFHYNPSSQLSIPIKVDIPIEETVQAWLVQFQHQWNEIDNHFPLLESVIQESGLSLEAAAVETLLITQDWIEEILLHPLVEKPLCPLTILATVGSEIELLICYDTASFEADAIARLVGHIQTLLAGMISMPDCSLARLPLLTPAEQQQLLVEWNNTQVPYPHDKCIHQIFEEQVARTPDAIALILPDLVGNQDDSLTYRELNDRANQLAAQLQQMGVKPETFVALIMERSIEMIVAILGILKAGGVYVPLDPAYPPERLAFMLEDANAPVLLTQSHLSDRLPLHQAKVIYLDGEWGSVRTKPAEVQPCILQPHNLAYVNYTSGSTGRPKGVAIPHRAVLRLVFHSNYALLNGKQTILQLAPISFDAATFEIWGALLHGGLCVLYPSVGIPDPQDLGKIICKTQVTTLFLTTALFNTIIAEAPEVLLGVKELLTGGEAISIPHIRKSLASLPDMALIHVYGPTESTTFSCSYHIPRQVEAHLKTLPIGQPIANTQTYVLDNHLQPVPVGVAGELYIGGDGLAREYLNRPDITLERFIANPFSSTLPGRLYKTGDQVRYLPDGNIEFIGRQDFQIKLRGFRIELGEIEAALRQHDQVADAMVILREDRPGDKYLVAYITVKGKQAPGTKQLKDYLRGQVAEFMVPAVLMVLDKMPLSPTGKIDRRALPTPSLESIDFIAPSTSTEQQLAAIWSDCLGSEEVSVEANFFDLGGTSLLGLQLIARVQKQFNSNLRAVKLYQYPTIRAMAQYLDREQKGLTGSQPVGDRPTIPRTTTGDIAIVGMAGRFPGAESVDELWRNLCVGAESTTFFANAELDSSEDAEIRGDAQYVPAKGIVRGAEEFDAAFFGISPREAEVMDPQARVFLELAHTALENAGYTPDLFGGLIGLYAGSGQNTYFERHLCGRKEIIDRLGAFQTMLANEKDFVTTRTSYKLNLTGPSVSLSTACSTSLVATIHAVQGLRSHQCDIALAGGVSITTPQNTGYLYQEGGMLSPDGRCRPFDAQAQGTMFNNGAGIVVLKRVEDALRDGDRIYATIKGVGINNDGSDKASFTAPSVHGQAGAIVKAQTDAGIHPETISYIETHGTATPLGDPIEVEALTQAFRTHTEATQFCAIGSVKGNVGHLVAAAGVTGLIKTALALYYKQIPPSVNFESPNPEIDFANSPFYVNTRLTDWQSGEAPRRAGVSSFGVGGTNAHVVLEEAPISESTTADSRPYQLLLLSAKSEAALQQVTDNLQKHLQQYPELDLADIAYTLQNGRRAFNHRRFVVCRDGVEAIAHLQALPPTRTATRYTDRRNPDIVFMFPGQGSQYVNMGRNLYEREPVFRSAIDRCARILQPLLDRDLREVLYPNSSATETSTTLLRQTLYTQPALFAVEYALAQLWQSWGIQPTALIGHSIGEFVAACLAGVFSLEDGLTLVATRGRMMWELPPGAMLSVRMPAAAVEPLLTGEMAIAAINGPALCVVAGPTEQVNQLQQALEAQDVVCKPLHTSHAFHSPMMDPIIPPFADLVRTLNLSPPTIPFISTVTAEWITDTQATDPLYWANHLRATVRFAEGVKMLWQQPQRVLLEVGPRTTAATLARQQATDLKQQIAISSLDSTAENESEWVALMQAIGQLWLAGVSFDWQGFYAEERRSRLPLPTYPFERQRYWIDPKPAVLAAEPAMQINSVSAIAPQHPEIAPVPSNPLLSLPPAMTDSRKQRLLPLLRDIVQTTSGLEVGDISEEITFLEIGLDSLSLTQMAMALKKQFKVKIAFRNLLEDYPNLNTLAEFLDQALPPEALPAPTVPAASISPDPAPTAIANPPVPQPATSIQAVSITHASPGTPLGTIETLVAQQLKIMAQQLELLNQARGGSVPVNAAPQAFSQPPLQPSALPPTSVNGTASTNGTNSTQVAAPTADAPAYKSKGPGAKIEKSNNAALTADQRTALDRLITRYTTRTQESKRQTQEHRRYLADPRTVSGFTPLLKEMVYPIVTDRSAGSKLWDVDGNEYVDLTNGFGLNFFGWNPDFVKAAVIAQMEKGIEIGPQSPLAGKVAKLISEFTGMERVAFCNTGSEAVMATLRLARTVTGRDLVATFTADYHGTFDEVLYRPGANLKTMPAAPGILPCMFENLLVLDYGTPESLEILRNRADDLAAILVEPVRSRDPGLQPKEFLRDLRHLTEQSGTAYIFDEVVTGFRTHPGGAQAYFGIQADMATYGKVVGGGIPIGIVAGKAEYMDALDGGFWQYGDNSIPEVGVTFFAGTFVRHPMALAAAEAVLLKLREGGESLQRSLTEKTYKLVTHLNQHLERVGAPIKLEHFTSYFYVSYPAELPYAQLLFYLLREKGVHIWDHRPCFLTLSHTDGDLEFITRAFKDSVAELQAHGFLGVAPAQASSNGQGRGDRNQPPLPGARLGKDPQGNPAWFIPDPERPGKYLQLKGAL